MPFPTLKIRSEGAVATECRIWLDDVEVSQWCRGLKLTMNAGEATTLDLQLYAGAVDVDADTILALAATLPQPLAGPLIDQLIEKAIADLDAATRALQPVNAEDVTTLADRFRRWIGRRG